ncbi:MAG: hypothetical protein WC302_03250 [Candidatus Paceibacterota bacterium]
MPRSIRKHIRNEKARIRREFSNTKEQKEKINNLYQRFLKQETTVKTEEKKEEN